MGNLLGCKSEADAFSSHPESETHYAALNRCMDRFRVLAEEAAKQKSDAS